MSRRTFIDDVADEELLDAQLAVDDTVDILAAAADEGPRRCRECGCNDERGCAGGCYWVESDSRHLPGVRPIGAGASQWRGARAPDPSQDRQVPRLRSADERSHRAAGRRRRTRAEGEVMAAVALGCRGCGEPERRWVDERGRRQVNLDPTTGL
ncbi:MAG TPA: hypothetical protein VN803_06725, partial [Gemmatimonadales bacterium]|nr:hypothetical protein [Gemmatimonadales bacterium]